MTTRAARVTVAAIAPCGIRADRPFRRGIALVAACAFAVGLAWTPDAGAIGLGPATVSSSLGEPLRMSVPISLQPDEEVGCVQVRPNGGDLPSVFNTRSQVVRSGGATRIEIRSAQSVDEPAIGLVVSVGCSSPIARDYVMFLDPPVVAATASGDVSSAAPRRAAPMPAPVRRAPSASASIRVPSDASGDSVGAPVRRRPPRPRARPRPVLPAPANVPAAIDRPATAVPSAPASPSAAAATGPVATDRLSVVPTDRAVGTPAPAVAPNGSPTAVPAPAVVTPDPDAMAREDALRQQQTALQAQVKSLNDQIAALRVQTTTLAARNQALEQNTATPTLLWFLIALAALALLIAAWMAWRYLQLRRSVEGSAWWTNNTMQAPGATAQSSTPSFEPGDLDPGTRIAPRSPVVTETRAPSVFAATPAPAAPQRPVVRPKGYPASIDTDFTVSDIEAAMATVRTVSPPRPPKSATPHDDSDFAPLGGPTLPSPFADPPPGAPALASAARSTAATPPPAVDELPPQFVDFDIPPIPPLDSKAAGRSAPTPPASPSPKADDFKLDAGDHFDPLGSDSLKTTVIDGMASRTTDFTAASTPTELDFELPSATEFMSMTSMMDEAASNPPRSAGMALDDLFATGDGQGIDTILDLDERHGAPLTTTEVDRLTSTEDGSGIPAADRQPRTRLARFADLMNRVDDAAIADPLRAIAQLRQFVLRDEQIPTLLWLRLFELYRQVDKMPVYNALGEHFARRYHRPMVGWNDNLASRVPQTPLAANPGIDREIESSWGTKAGHARLEELLCGRDQDDTIVFNAVLQRDLLDAAKIFPSKPPAAGTTPGSDA